MVMEELGVANFDREYDHLRVVMEAEADEEERLAEGALQVQLGFVLGAALLVAATILKSKFM